MLRRRINKQLGFALLLFVLFDKVMQAVGVGIGVDWYYLQIALDLSLLGFSQLLEEAKTELSVLLVVSILSNVVTAYDYLYFTNFLYDNYPTIMQYLFQGCIWSILIHLILINTKFRKREIDIYGTIHRDRRKELVKR